MQLWQVLEKSYLNLYLELYRIAGKLYLVESIWLQVPSIQNFFEIIIDHLIISIIKAANANNI